MRRGRGRRSAGARAVSCALAAASLAAASLAAGRPGGGGPTAIGRGAVTGRAASGTAPATTIPLFAYYYIWFSHNSWARAKKDLPLIGAVFEQRSWRDAPPDRAGQVGGHHGLHRQLEGHPAQRPAAPAADARSLPRSTSSSP